MELNSDQIKIVNELNNFIFDIKNKNKFYLLTGLAGTGKTSLITYFLSLPILNNMKIAVTGCTNKAVGVLESLYLKNHIIKENPKENKENKENPKENKENPKENKKKDLKEVEIKKDDKLNFLTIHKLLQIKRKIDANGQEVFESIIDENNIKIKSKSVFYYDLIIIDEVSMLNRDMTLQLLKLQSKIKGKIIFLGDKAQLPPVKEAESHIFQLNETQIPQGHLTKIMRSGDQLINFVNSIRELIDNPKHKVPFNKLANSFNENEQSRIGLYRNKEDEWINKYLKENDENDQIILCYTNKRVEYLNKRIRKALYKTDKNDYVDGEKIIFNNSYSLSTNANKYDSSQMVKIKSSSVDKILIRGFNLYDILNTRFPLNVLDSNSEFLMKKHKVPKLAYNVKDIEKNNIRIPDENCQICFITYSLSDNNNNDTDTDKNQFTNICGHHYCLRCLANFKSFPNKKEKVKTSSKKEDDNTFEQFTDNTNTNGEDDDFILEKQKVIDFMCPLCVISVKDGIIKIKNDPELTKMINELKKQRDNTEYKTWLIKLENNDLLYVIHPDVKEKYINDVDLIKQQLRDINNYITNRYKHKDKLWQQLIQQLWDFHYYYFIDQFAVINYGNAITTHRSQGSTYKKVYVDLIDIIKCNDVPKEGFQCLYTAVTRASDNLELFF